MTCASKNDMESVLFDNQVRILRDIIRREDSEASGTCNTHGFAELTQPAAQRRPNKLAHTGERQRNSCIRRLQRCGKSKSIISKIIITRRHGRYCMLHGETNRKASFLSEPKDDRNLLSRWSLTTRCI